MKTFKTLIILVFIVQGCGAFNTTDSQSAEVIVEDNALIYADMDFELQETHGTLKLFAIDANIHSSIKSINACIGYQESCLAGTGKTWNLVPVEKTFNFPVKISLLRNLQMQVYVKFKDGRSIHEKITITDDWSKEVAQKLLKTNELTVKQDSFGLTDSFWQNLSEIFNGFSGNDIYTDPYTPIAPINDQQIIDDYYLPQPPTNMMPIPQIKGDIDSGNYQGQSLAADQLFNQGPTNHCWGYATFHALRQYYSTTGKNDADASQWIAALNKFNDSQTFRAYMDKQMNPQNSFGNSERFLGSFVQQNGLPYSWSTNAGAYQAVSNLKRGIPSASCDGQHCVAFLTIDQSDTVTIGDSSGGYTYQRHSSDLNRYMGFLSK